LRGGWPSLDDPRVSQTSPPGAEEGAPSRARRAAGAALVLVAGVAFLAGLEAHFRPLAAEGTYFQEHSSEDMMQTLSLLDLRERPLESLLVLHIQPPLLDTLRAALARSWPEAPPRPLVRRVDRALYALWIGVYAASGALVFAWLERLPPASGSPA
jgi:hypothetical protein